MVVVQCDAVNRSRINTVVCVPLTSNLKLANSPGNVALSADATGLGRDSVANVSLVTAVDKDQLDERVGRVSQGKLQQIFAGIDTILGR